MTNYDAYMRLGEQISKGNLKQASAIAAILSKHIQKSIQETAIQSTQYQFERKEKDIMNAK